MKALDPAASQFIEQVGLIWESDGFPRGAGRLLGLLLITPGEASLDDLAAQLGLTKPAVSVNARLLEQRGIIERVGHPADRRDYYRAASDLLQCTMEQRLQRWRRFHEAVAGARRTLGIKDPAVAERLDTLDLAYQHVFEVLTTAMEQWQQRKSSRKRTAAGRA